MVSGRNLNLSKLPCISLLPARMKMIQSKKETTFSHYKSMWIFPDAQGKQTPQFVFRSGHISDLFENVWLSLLLAKMKTIRTEIKALECS